MRIARTAAEAHLFMDLSPCRCGESRFDRRQALFDRDGQLVTRYTGACAGCGGAREFELALDDEIPRVGERLCYGGDRASQLIDPAQFLAVADAAAQRVPPDLEVAIAALDEVLKFIPPGGDAVPESAMSAAGLGLYRLEPGRFRRARLAAVRGAYLDLLARGR